MKCDLCGTEFSGITEGVWAVDSAACNPCIEMLIENEVERRGVRRDEETMSGPGLYESETHRMIEAQGLKR